MKLIKMGKPISLWTLPKYYQDNWETIDMDWFKFAVSQAEKSLNETVKTGEVIAGRGYSLLALQTSYLTIVLGYAVSHSVSEYPVFMYGAFLLILALVCALVFTISCIWPYNVVAVGSEPKLLLRKELIEGVVVEDQYKNLLLCELENFQRGIDHNSKMNSQRMQWFKTSLKISVATPLALVVGWALNLAFQLGL